MAYRLFREYVDSYHCVFFAVVRNPYVLHAELIIIYLLSTLGYKFMKVSVNFNLLGSNFSKSFSV